MLLPSVTVHLCSNNEINQKYFVGTIVYAMLVLFIIFDPTTVEYDKRQ